MANEVHQKIDVALADFDFDANFDEIDSVADGDLVWSAPVTSCEDCERVQVLAEITVGTPTKGNTIEFYVGRNFNSKYQGTDDDTFSDHGEATDSDDVYAILGALGPHVGLCVCDDEAATVYTVSFDIWYPTDSFNLFVYNNTGDAFAASGHDVAYRGWLPELQD